MAAKSSPLVSLSQPMQGVQLNEIGCPEVAVCVFKELLVRSGRDSVLLHCSVPTWGYSDTCVDLHDLYALRTRSLVFIHELVNSLRSCGISASYRLAPAQSPLCAVCASTPDHNATKIKTTLSLLQTAKLQKRENVFLADLEQCPSLILT
ncbi:hypothetical protein VKT23_003398 [Stygiomarasmius scandens]|uniref:Uncharacterized protein n=1 Tax=Marasmiellus scandens TaxID=2682957 RepID=A0ABR1JX29_9AGAR